MIPIEQIFNGTYKQTGFTKHYRFLYSLIEGLEVKNSFEFGTGLSTQVICEALRLTGGKHTSCDPRDLKDTGLPDDFKTNYSDIWTYKQCDSRLVVFPKEPLDFVLHDGSHLPAVVLQDIKKIVKLMKRNSILLVHDSLNEKYNPSLEGIVKQSVKDINHELVTLPYGYGLTIVKILDEFNNNGTVTPTWRKQW